MLINSLHQSPQRCVRLRYAVGLVAGAAALLALAARLAGAQEHAHAAEAPASPTHAHTASAASANAALHMEMTPALRPTAADSLRAAKIAAALRVALAKYTDTTAAVADGYHMFLPGVKTQKVYHFTNNWRAMQEAVRFEPTRPTSLLYRKDSTGTLVLIGAMYTAPKRFSYERLDARVPLSIARWHKHVNWCLPKRGEMARWTEQRDGVPVFGPESPVVTKEACDAVGGRFMPTVFGWMLHANVFAGDDPASVWGDEHAGPDMHAGMKMHGLE
ncbi:MAG: hypothetical protein HOQ30_06525 [Gemmatimonadaceae bacterium]|nr:hypothetical protein [Gemmatimonadaceae bacterium]